MSPFTHYGGRIIPQQVLNDDEKRQRYDQFGEAGVGMGGGGGGAGFDVSTKAEANTAFASVAVSSAHEGFDFCVPVFT